MYYVTPVYCYSQRNKSSFFGNFLQFFSQSFNDLKFPFLFFSHFPVDELQIYFVLFERIKKSLKQMIEFINKYEAHINVEDEDDDDIKFYSSIIINSKNYFIASHKAREKKIIFDLNSILDSINKSKITKIYKFNKSSIDVIETNFKKLKDDVKLYEKNIGILKPKWRKDDKNKEALTIEKEMIRSFQYHIDINVYFYESLKSELDFFGIKTK